MKTKFKHSVAIVILHLMLMFLISTLIQGQIPFSLNRIIVFFLLLIIIYHDFCNLTKWRLFLFCYIAVSASFTTFKSAEVSLNIKDWIYFATTLLFVDFVSDSSVSNAFSSAMEEASKPIHAVSMACCVLTLVSMVLPGSYAIEWGDTYYMGFTGYAHTAACSLSLLAAFRLLAFRGKPFSLIDLCQLVFIMTVVFMTGARTYIIPVVIIVYSYLEKKIHKSNAKMIMYGLIFMAVIIIFVNSKMLDKFIWTSDVKNISAVNQLSAITNGRSVFWMIDLREFAKGNLLEKILGCGFDYVYQTNLEYYGLKIWAHNDLVHLLLGSGLLSICVYITVWIRFWLRYKNYVKSWQLRLCIVVYIILPMMFNGLFMHAHYFMSVIVLTFFLSFEDEKRQDGTWLNPQMNIAMFGHKRIPSREGGVEVVVEELSTRMAALRHPVTCYNRGGHHVSGAEFNGKALTQYKGVKIQTVPTLDRKGVAAVTSSFGAAVCSAFSRAEIVHIHAEGPAFMCWIPKLFGKRVVVTVHGLDWQREKWKPGSFASRFIHMGEKMAVSFADEIIVLSRNVQDYFWTTYRRETKWIPNGVVRPDCAETDEIKKQFGLCKDGYILFLGRLVPEKGIHYLIKAFQRVDTDKKLVIAGGSSDTEDYLQRLKRLAADDERIIFTGFVQGRMLEELYSNAYVYVLPSDVEGMPLSLLEAMSFGNCCLTSDIEECMEVTRQQGLAFRKGDVTDLSEKLQYLCHNPEQVEKYKENAADYICQKYSWDTVVEGTLALYRGESEYEGIAGQ